MKDSISFMIFINIVCIYLIVFAINGRTTLDITYWLVSSIVHVSDYLKAGEIKYDKEYVQSRFDPRSLGGVECGLILYRLLYIRFCVRRKINTCDLSASIYSLCCTHSSAYLIFPPFRQSLTCWLDYFTIVIRKTSVKLVSIWLTNILYIYIYIT